MNTLHQKIKIINQSHHPLPAYKSQGAAGMDLTAFLAAPLTLEPHLPTLIPTGLYIALPQGLEGQVRPRSGLSSRHGIMVTNAPGTIDSDYRGEIKVSLVNITHTPFEVRDGDRIAQLVVAPHAMITWEPVDKLTETIRGERGFGSTGVGD